MYMWIPAWRYSQGIYKLRVKNPSLFTVHYGAVQSYDALVNYFANNPDRRWADSTWCVGQDGQWCCMVRPQDTPWTNGNGLGNFVDEYGNLTSLINDIAFTAETSNDIKDGFYEYTEKHYETLASLFKWTLENFQYTHVTRICSHEQLTPAFKQDVGKLFDWEKFLVKYVGMKQEIYDGYMKYLQETSNISGPNCWSGISAEQANRKKQICLDSFMRIHRDLYSRPSSYYMK